MATARDRLLDSAYALFQQNSFNAVGVDRIVAQADVAKTTLYRHFASKDDLTVSVLRHHGDVWMSGWLEAAIAARAGSAGARLLAVFDAFDDWFRRDDYEGCLFTRALLEMRDPENPIRAEAVRGLASVRTMLRGLAEEAGARDPGLLAQQLQLLLLGTTVAAVAGESDAALRAKDAARLLLEQEGIAVAS